VMITLRLFVSPAAVDIDVFPTGASP